MNSLVVLSVVLAVAAANPSGLGLGLAGVGWGAPWGGVASPWAAGLATPLAAGLGAPLVAGIGAPLVAGIGAPWGGIGVAAAHGAGAIGPVTSVAAAPLNLAINYRGPVSLAPGQPANILAQDGRPLDTLSVNLDRANHLTARALSGHGHLLKKRSVGLIAPAVAWSHVSRIDLPAARLALPLAHAAPLVSPVAPIAPWGVGHWGRVW